MNYKFICPKCNKQIVISIPITQYRSKGHFCECGAELKRDINDYCTTSQRFVEGFFGVSKKK